MPEQVSKFRVALCATLEAISLSLNATSHVSSSKALNNMPEAWVGGAEVGL
jgi:hypothetical protein